MRTCIHRASSGRLCGSPALRSRPYCYHHQKRIPKAVTRARQYRNLPVHSNQHRFKTLNFVFHAMMRRDIPRTVADKLLLELQNLPRQ